MNRPFEKAKLSAIENMKFPFIIIMRAETPGRPISTTRTKRMGKNSRKKIERQFQNFSSNLATQYLRLFEIWLTKQFKPDSQVVYSTIDDMTYVDQYETRVPTVNLKQLNLI